MWQKCLLVQGSPPRCKTVLEHLTSALNSTRECEYTHSSTPILTQLDPVSLGAREGLQQTEAQLLEAVLQVWGVNACGLKKGSFDALADRCAVPRMLCLHIMPTFIPCPRGCRSLDMVFTHYTHTHVVPSKSPIYP